MEEEEKLVLVRRLPPPPLMLTRGRLDGITARDRGGGGGGTRDGYEYTLVSKTDQYKLIECLWSKLEYNRIQSHGLYVFFMLFILK